MATMVLTVVGTALGGPIGAAIGATLGQVIDNQILFAPKARTGARLSDLRLQTSRYGDSIPKIYGTMRVAGSVIWATDLIESRHRQSAGKGQPKVTTYSYSVSFAVALSSRSARAVRRIWADGNLLRGTAGDFKTSVGAFRFYTGTENQNVDPLIAAHKGIAATPAHRGIAYAVFEDMQLADYGNRIPSLTFELVADDGSVYLTDIANDLSDGVISGDTPGDMVQVRGFAATGDNIADAIVSLVEGLNVAVQYDGGALKLTQGDDVGGIINRGMIGASFNGDNERVMRLSRGRAEDVPVRLVGRYYDPARDYQAGAQTAERPGGGRTESNLDLPATLYAAEARHIVEAQMQRLWAGRDALEIRCDWSALPLIPASIISVEGYAGRWRIEQSEWEAMGVRLRLKRVSGAFSGDLPASSGDSVLQIDALHGPTSLMIADLPVPDDSVPTAPVVVAAMAGSSAGWRMAELFVEDDAAGGMISLGGGALPAIMGEVVTIPDAAASAMLFDDVSVVDIELQHGGMALFSVTEEALLAGGNYALLGQEIVQFGQAERMGETRWRLRHLLRGRRGTEWAMPLHEVGERFLLIEEVSLFSLPSAYIRVGGELRVRAIGIGDAAPVQQNIIVTGEAIKPLSPVHPRAEWRDGGWHIQWIRRSRQGWNWADGTDAPLSEELERYYIALYHEGALIRTTEVAASQWVYDADMIAADRASGASGSIIAEIHQIGTYGAGRSCQISLTI